MKKLGLGILVSLVALAISSGAMAIPDQAADKAKEKAKAPALEKIEFIHWKKGFAKPSLCENGEINPGEKCGETGLPECPEGKVCENCKCIGEEEPEEPSTTCYAFMGQYGKKLLKWKETSISYAINPANPYGLSISSIISAISAGAEEWDANTDTELFGAYSIDETATYGVLDNVNAISFGNYYLNPSIIGVATVWYNPATKEIVEFDIVFETDYTWGDATVNSKVMDLQNIATHELGHGVGLADVYETECGEVTMYGYSDYGETQKRDLAQPDITGLKKLYDN